MQPSATIAACISSIAFLVYGVGLLLSNYLITDFARYGLARYRVLVALLQVAGSAGLALGIWYQPLMTLAAAGLALMMFFALLARRRIHDPLANAMPAFLLFLLNLYVFLTALSSQRA